MHPLPSSGAPTWATARRLLLALLLLCLLSAGCMTLGYSPPQPVSPPPEVLAGPLIGSRWRVESISFPGVAEPADFALPFWILFDTAGAVRMEADACMYDSLLVEYEAATPSLKIGERRVDAPGPTCSANLLSRLVGKTLTNASMYAIEGDQLTLRNDDNTISMLLLREQP